MPRDDVILGDPALQLARDRVALAALDRYVAEQEWKRSIVAAHALGVSLRAIGLAAGVSHVRILQIVRGE